VDADLRRKD